MYICINFHYQYMGHLQSYSFFFQKYSEAHLLRPLLHERVSAAIEGLSMALQSLAIYQDQNTSILYGNCYVMSKGKEGGITWQHQAK